MSTTPSGPAWEIIQTVGNMAVEGHEPGELVHGPFED
jgi:hypothetical protein